MTPATKDGKEFTFLGLTELFGGDWSRSGCSKLWLYNLHYQDDLNAKGARANDELCHQMIDAWILGNPFPKGAGWEPYCISLRVVNWVKYFYRLERSQLNSEWLESLSSQTDALEQQLEFHLLANHLFANAKALVFVGTFLGGKQGDRWLHLGLKLLEKEILEQFLNDGAHYELSPMYQAILLWDLADLQCLAKVTGLPELERHVGLWEAKFSKGMGWLYRMTHPDGQIAFFNDAAFNIGPTFHDLQKYADQLGISIPIGDSGTVLPIAGCFMKESGYASVEWAAHGRLIIDVAFIGASYQPGHAHADTLSCEFSLFGQRIFVNSGISQYGEDAERTRQRSTAAHNTLEVDGQNSSEVWAGFRVARRAQPFDVEFSAQVEDVAISASHDGYHRLVGKVTHRRLWVAKENSLIIEDSLTGVWAEAKVYWHFHPDITIERLDDERFLLQLKGGSNIMLHIMGGEAKLLDGTWHPRFGESVVNKKLVINIYGSKMRTSLHWR
ncbi:heparinase II/III family protein [Halopseudomonas bauzanensis]|nr:heparinase II/III family protein [Halopseudomonas bauzanensis]